MREREGKSGGGKGPLLSEKSFTLSTSNFQTIFILDGTRVGDVRWYEDSIMQTVISRWGTGGGNVPMIYPIDDGREVEKNQNGTGIGNDGDPAYTLDRQQAPAVAQVYPIDTRNALRDPEKKDAQNRQGLGVGEAGAPSPTLTDVFTPAVVQAFDTYNQTVSEKNQTLRHQAADNDHIGTIWQSSTVRRLTPIECERLQGFPDGWTEGQADSHRYKQMGNAVAVPVVQWIIDRMTK